MFFLGGMTMGYLEPPAKRGRTEEEARLAVLPAEGDRRKIEPARHEAQDNATLRSLIWSWHTVC